MPDQRARRLPGRLWLIVALQALLMACTMVLYPSFQNPDEASHVDYVLAHRHGEWLDAPGQRQYQSGTRAAQSLVPAIQFREHVGTRTPLPRAKRLSFDELGTAPVKAAIPNQMTQHPPLYYGLAAGFSYLLPYFDHHRFDVQVAWLRLFSLLLLLPVPILIFTAARRATGSQTVALVASALPLSLPSYLRSGASVNNDSLLLLLSSVLVALLVRVTFGDLSRRVALLVGLAWAGALLSKGFALAMPPAIVVAYLVGARGSLRQRLALAWRPVLIAGAVGTVLGGWWWVRNLALYGTVQPDGLGQLSDTVRQQIFGRDGAHGTELNFFVQFFRLLGLRIWGSIGLIDTPSLSHRLLFGLSGLLLLAVLASLVAGLGPVRARSAWLRATDWRLDRAVSLLLPVPLTLLVMYVGARPRYLHGRQLSGDQVRYLLPAMLGMLICVGVALHWLSGRLHRWLAPVVLTGSLLFVAGSAYQVLDLEMSNNSPGRAQRLSAGLRFVIGWSPLPGPLTGALFVLTALVAAAAVVGFWRQAAVEG